LFAKNLERVLHDYLLTSDVSSDDRNDIATRFESLRGYGRLPRGRENRTQHLTPQEIASSILGLVPVRPRWAGHGAVVLSGLRPVGGVRVSFMSAPNLIAAIERLVDTEETWKSLVSLAISPAEFGINSHGRADLTFESADISRTVVFIPGTAASLLQPGKDQTTNLDHFAARTSRLLVFKRDFFRRLFRAIELSKRFSREPEGDGSEYDAEEAAQARYRALGVTHHSNFLNLGVDAQVDWPDREVLVHFDGYRLVLMPRTKDNAQSIHVDLDGNQLTIDQAKTLVNRFLSVLSWSDDQFSIVQPGWAGNPVPVPVPKRNLAFATANGWPTRWTCPASEEVRIAFALYREGRNAEEAALISYAVLSYFKIIEIRNPKGPDVRNWISANFEAIRQLDESDYVMSRFLASCGGETPADYINKACRVAVAHASIKHRSDADDADEISRLYSASQILRLLARRFISEELGMKDDLYTA
jgi:hypothetical protein